MLVYLKGFFELLENGLVYVYIHVVYIYLFTVFPLISACEGYLILKL